MRLREGGGRLKMGEKMWWKKEKGRREGRGGEGEGEKGEMMGRCEGEVEMGQDGMELLRGGSEW